MKTYKINVLADCDMINISYIVECENIDDIRGMIRRIIKDFNNETTVTISAYVVNIWMVVDKVIYLGKNYG